VSKLTTAHLEPFVQAFRQALREGTITIRDAEFFCVDTYDALLEQKVAVHTSKGKPRDAKKDVRTDQEEPTV
jgi:hypothetical protein